MDTATIGAILKKRIHEQGFTQENFAEKAGIGYATLKKYLNGSNPYSIEKLEMFSELLNCSYDFLMGRSRSPIRENMILSNDLHFSDKAIEIIKNYARNSDNIVAKKLYISTLNTIIENDGLVEIICNYLMSSMNTDIYVNQLGNQMYDYLKEQNVIDDDLTGTEFSINTSTSFIIAIVQRLVEIKNNTPKEITEDINMEYQTDGFIKMKDSYKTKKKKQRKKP